MVLQVRKCFISTKVLTTSIALVAAIILLCSLCCFRKVYIEKMMNPLFVLCQVVFSCKAHTTFKAFYLSSILGWWVDDFKVPCETQCHCCLAPCKSVTNYGPLTEPKFYIVKSGLTQIPTSNGHISETKRGILDPLVPKFFSRRGLSSPLSWKWANVTLSPSFGLFQSEKPLFRGVPEGSQGTSLARICPQVPFPRGKKKIYMAPHTLACRVKFMSSFVLALSVFTQPVWKRMYLGF